MYQCLGSGGFGVVFNVRNRATGQIFAAKRSFTDSVDQVGGTRVVLRWPLAAAPPPPPPSAPSISPICCVCGGGGVCGGAGGGSAQAKKIFAQEVKRLQEMRGEIEADAYARETIIRFEDGFLEEAAGSLTATVYIVMEASPVASPWDVRVRPGGVEPLQEDVVAVTGGNSYGSGCGERRRGAHTQWRLPADCAQRCRYGCDHVGMHAMYGLQTCPATPSPSRR